MAHIINVIIDLWTITENGLLLIQCFSTQSVLSIGFYSSIHIHFLLYVSTFSLTFTLGKKDQKQLKVKCLAQGYFGMQTGGARD